MNRKILLICLILFSIVLLSGCSGSSTTETSDADVSDETVFTPPEQDGKLTGVWGGQDGILKINNYFYGDGKFVSFVQDPEEEIWCILAYWNEDGQSVTLNDQKYYRYDTSAGEWLEDTTQTIGMISAQQTSDDQLEATCTVPDGNQQTVTFTRTENDLQIPSDVDINLIINGFLIH